MLSTGLLPDGRPAFDISKAAKLEFESLNESTTNPTPYLNDNQLKGMALASYILKPENKDVLIKLLESGQIDEDSLADAILAHSFNVSNDYRVYNFNLANRAKDFLISLQDEQTSNNRPDESGTAGQA